MSLLALVAQVATAATYIVVNSNDSGAGSLRQAITDANADGSGTIEVSAPLNLTPSSPCLPLPGPRRSPTLARPWLPGSRSTLAAAT
ncbi:hypothetical protein [Thauera humireducens]|uniref:hypothetical protein n=1 Tax=Thauera humireducens TaxID=1134435 RepID=UPI00311D3ABF